jgi:hypothetical protein
MANFIIRAIMSMITYICIYTILSIKANIKIKLLYAIGLFAIIIQSIFLGIAIAEYYM